MAAATGSTINTTAVVLVNNSKRWNLTVSSILAQLIFCSQSTSITSFVCCWFWWLFFFSASTSWFSRQRQTNKVVRQDIGTYSCYTLVEFLISWPNRLASSFMVIPTDCRKVFVKRSLPKLCSSYFILVRNHCVILARILFLLKVSSVTCDIAQTTQASASIFYKCIVHCST